MSYLKDTNVGSSACPYLGRCNDPETYYSFPSFDNCCHTEAEPFPIEPSYQADTCLGKTWAECPRYKAAQEGTGAKQAAAAGWQQRIKALHLPVWAIAGLVAGIGLFLGVLLLILLPKDSTSDTFTPTSGLVSLTPGANGTDIAAQSPSATATLTLTPSPSPTATATWTPTRTPTSTRTPTPTRTRTPTATPTRTPTRTATATRTFTPAPTTPTSLTSPTPAATGTPFPAPTLLSPADGERFQTDAKITLKWQSVGSLPADVYYVITVAYTHNAGTWYDDNVWTQETSWGLNEHSYLLEYSDDGRFQWSVQILQQTGTDVNGKPTGTPRSPKSKVRTLIWQLPSRALPTSIIPPP